MRIDHLEMAFGHGQINRLADRTARMMQTRMHIGQLYQILKIFHRCIAALIIQVAHEWGAVNRGKNRVHPANLNRTFRIAGMLSVGRGCGCAKLPRKATREMHALALNITANITQNGQGFGIIAKIDTNFLKDRFGIVFNDLGAFVAEDIKRRNLAGNKGGCGLLVTR